MAAALKNLTFAGLDAWNSLHKDMNLRTPSAVPRANCEAGGGLTSTLKSFALRYTRAR